MMKQSEAKRIFEESYGGNLNLRNAIKKDMLAVKFDWDCFIDALCKNGDITIQQYESWMFPW